MGEFARTRWEIEDLSMLQKRELLLRQIERIAPDVLRTLEAQVYSPFKHLLPVDQNRASYQQTFLEAWDERTEHRQARQIESLEASDAVRAENLRRIRTVDAERYWYSTHNDTVTRWYGLNNASKWCP